MYQYTKRLRLIYNFRDKQSTEKNESLIKLTSNWSPYLTDNTEFKNIIRTLTNISFTYKPVEDNLKGLRDDLDDLVYATQTGKIVIKKADKGSIITIMSPPFYWDMCLNHLNNTEYYEKVTNDPYYPSIIARYSIASSLGQRIVRLVSEERQLRLQQLKSELIKRGHPAKIIDDTFSKLLTPVRDRSSTALESIPFIYTYNPGTKFNKNKITKCLENVKTCSSILE